MKGKVQLVRANEDDAEAITKMMVSVENNERKRWYEDGDGPYIPGFDSVDMQKYHQWNEAYFKILFDGELSGVILISHTGREHARLDRLFIDPSWQDKGIGSTVITLIESMYPQVKLWTLDTFQKSTRNHHFYEKMGYKLAGEDEYERYYFKTIEEESHNQDEYTCDKNFNHHNFRHCNMQNVDFYSVNLQGAHYTNMNMSHVVYQNSNLSHNRYTNTNMSHSVFGDSNMNATEICHVSMAGAYLHDIKLGTGKDKIPLVMERCELMGSSILDSNLQNLSIVNCNLEGMTIDGIHVSELLEVYKKQQS
ncbi:GNAT family N-acetyltransferase [Aureibacillus halotolerans]|uniref:Pentapeptide repeat protein n=1 Tax=Aureibacillus halotolerans TaxID=1508390 RepID=A0A4R6TSM1_9BACI|nr:GNAT family N-acetyltransferase [Aureibacillus halotolerans]TDQ36620.1 pentapeptide repeat protein [Aureibacillus halotolerans]